VSRPAAAPQGRPTGRTIRERLDALDAERDALRAQLGDAAQEWLDELIEHGEAACSAAPPAGDSAGVKARKRK
jgi:hypothetical protein